MGSLLAVHATLRFWGLLLELEQAADALFLFGFGLLGGGYFRDGDNGPIRADVTLANPDFTGIFLAMLIPVALAKVVSRRPLATRYGCGQAFGRATLPSAV